MDPHLYNPVSNHIQIEMLFELKNWGHEMWKSYRDRIIVQNKTENILLKDSRPLGSGQGPYGGCVIY